MSALLFLGFQLTDWSFRVLFRLIMSQGGRRRLDEYTHGPYEEEFQADLDKHKFPG